LENGCFTRSATKLRSKGVGEMALKSYGSFEGYIGKNIPIDVFASSIASMTKLGNTGTPVIDETGDRRGH